MSDNGQLSASELAPIASGQLRKDAAAAWNAMNVEARKLGLELHPTGSMSSYRTYAQQVYLRGLYERGQGALAAIPGTSNHGWGLAVDVPTLEMRAMIDRIGSKYGFSKRCSDAQSEWWHIKYDPVCNDASWHGSDPGPSGAATVAPPIDIQEGDMITAVLKKNGAIEVFVEKESSGAVWHTWQTKENGEWWGKDKDSNAGWQNLGIPGGKK